MMNPQQQLRYEISSHIPHSISRVWFIVRDASIVSLLSSTIHFPLIVKEGKNTWNIESEFQGKHKDFEYTGKCIKVRNFPQYKKIAWEIQIQNKKIFIVQYSLYQVLNDNSTVILYKIKFQEKEIYDKWKQIFKTEHENEFQSLVDKINITLSDSSLFLFQYEGGVIQSSMDNIWNYIHNMDLLKKAVPGHKYEIEYEGNKLEPNIGNIIKITYDNKKKFYLCKTTILNKQENWNKWAFGFEAFYGQPKIPYQKCIITLTKVNKNEVHLAFYHEFKEAVDNNKIAQLSKEKKHFIKSLQEYFSKQNVIKKEK